MFRSNNEGREIPVGKSNLLLRGCIIRNTDWAEGMVVYAGKEMLLHGIQNISIDINGGNFLQFKRFPNNLNCIFL